MLTVDELDGLNASAVADALTWFPVFPHILEKKLGRLARVSFTVTIGFTPKDEVARVVQSGVPAPTVPPDCAE